MGEIESPSIWKLEFSEDPEKHVVLHAVGVDSREGFLSELSHVIQRSSKKSAFIFVHGYNVSFADAAKRTAQISYDLGFDGAPVFYSWPSAGELDGYRGDEESIKWAQGHIEAFIKDVTEQTGAESIYLIAHSMGNRGLTRAFSNLIASESYDASVIKEVVLTAPDIDAEVFRNEIAPKIRLPIHM